MSIVIVGSVAFDSIETPFGAVERALGGSGTYISLSARHFVAQPRLVAVVGKDFPAPHIELLRASGIDLEGLQHDAAGLTFHWAGRYHFDMNTRDTLATDLNVLGTFDPVLPASYRDSRVVCLGNLHPSTQQRVLDQVDGPDLVICDTMNYWIEHAMDSLRETLRRLDILIINDEEARELAQDPNLVRASRKIRAMGPKTVIIKKGEHGALLFEDGAVFSAPAYPLEDIHDPTGAGDTFMGGFAGYLAGCRRINSEALKRAMIYGSALASFAVERFGVERLIDLTREEIEARVAEFRLLSTIPN